DERPLPGRQRPAYGHRARTTERHITRADDLDPRPDLSFAGDLRRVCLEIGHAPMTPPSVRLVEIESAWGLGHGSREYPVDRVSRGLKAFATPDNPRKHPPSCSRPGVEMASADPDTHDPADALDVMSVAGLDDPVGMETALVLAV